MWKYFDLWHFIQNFGAKPLHLFKKLDAFIEDHGSKHYMALTYIIPFSIQLNTLQD